MDSFNTLCERYYPALTAIAHAVLGDRHLAEDAAQEAFAKAVRNLGKLRHTAQFVPWLSTICRNIARDMVRNNDKLYFTRDVPPHAAADRRNDVSGIVREAINHLPDSKRALVYLRFYDGMTYEEISAVLGISKQAINGRLRRAKKSIARYLKRHSSIEVNL